MILTIQDLQDFVVWVQILNKIHRIRHKGTRDLIFKNDQDGYKILTSFGSIFGGILINAGFSFQIFQKGGMTRYPDATMKCHMLLYKFGFKNI